MSSGGVNRREILAVVDSEVGGSGIEDGVDGNTKVMVVKGVVCFGGDEAGR